MLEQPSRKSQAILRGSAGLVIPTRGLGFEICLQGDFRIVSGALYLKPYVRPGYLPLPVPNFTKWYEIRADNVAPVVTTGRPLAVAPYSLFMLMDPPDDVSQVWMCPWGPKRFLRALKSAGFVVADRYGVEQKSAGLLFLSIWWPLLLVMAIVLALLRFIVFA